MSVPFNLRNKISELVPQKKGGAGRSRYHRNWSLGEVSVGISQCERSKLNLASRLLDIWGGGGGSRKYKRIRRGGGGIIISFLVFPFREKVALLVPKTGVARVGKKGLFASPVALFVVSRGRRGKKEVPSSKSSLFPRRETLKKDFFGQPTNGKGEAA